MIEDGLFAGIDAALLFHPCDRNHVESQPLASEDVDIVFTGLQAHAASDPWKGQQRARRDDPAVQLGRAVAPAAPARRPGPRDHPGGRHGREHHPGSDPRLVHAPQPRAGLLRGHEGPLLGARRGRGARHRDDGRGDVLRRRDVDAPEPDARGALGRERRRLRDRGPGPGPELRQHRHGQRQLGLPDDPPRARDLRGGRAGSLDPLPRRGRDAAGRRDDPARGDARRPDAPTSSSPIRRSSRRRGASSAARPEPGQAANGLFPGASIRAGAPRWTTDANRRRPERDGDRDAGGPIGPVAVRRRRTSWPSAPTTPTAAGRDFAAANGWDREYETYSDFELPTYVGPDHVHEPAVDHRPGRAPRAGRRRRDRRRAVRRRRQPPARARASGRARSARRSTPRARSTRSSSASSRSRSSTVVDAGDANIVPAWIERAHALIYRKVREVAGHGRDPDRARRRPLDHVAVGDGGRRGPPAGQHRDRPLRRPRRHGERRLGRPRRPRHADAPAHRVGRGRRPELRPGRPARLLAAGRRVRVDAGARPALPLHDRDRGARRRRRDRRRDRRGARRPRRDLPEPRHRRRRSRARAGHGHAGAGRDADPRVAAGDPPDRRRGRARRDGHRRGLAAVRPRRDDVDDREPGRARGDQRAGREEGRRPGRPRSSRAHSDDGRRRAPPNRSPTPSPASTTSTSSRTRATSISTSRSPRASRGPSSSSPRARAASPSRWRRPATT